MSFRHLKQANQKTILDLFRNNRLVFGLLSVLFFLPPSLVHAIMYQPGETLNPLCVPTDTNCGVATTTLSNVGHLVPDNANLYDLGSPDTPWRSLYLSSSTLYLGIVPVSIANGTLIVAGNEVITTAMTSGTVDLSVATSTYAQNAGTSTIAEVALSLSGFNQGNYLTLSEWNATTTDALAEGATNKYYTNARFDSRLNSKTTNDLIEGGNLYYTNARFDNRLADKNSDDLAEGISNLYFTDIRARNTLSSSALGLTYATSTGAFSLTGGYTIPLTAGTTNWNTTYNTVNASSTNWDSAYSWGDHAIGGYLTDISWGDIAGSLSGQTDLQNSLNTKEPTINASTTATYWRGDKTFQTLDTSIVPENGNVYYTSARFDSSFAGKNTDNLTEGSNLYWTPARGDENFISNLSATTTDALAEGATNKYYTNARFDSRLNSKTTNDLIEGGNLYYTNARFDSRLADKNSDDLAEGISNLYFTDIRARNTLSSSALGLTYATSTGAFSLTGGYTIPLTAGTTNWNTTYNTVNASSTNWDSAYSWGDHAIGGYLTDISWGDIAGSLSGQTDLQNSLNTKESTINASTTATYWRGDKTFQTLDTSIVPENGNVYYTSARFDSSFAGKNTDNLTEGSNLYWTPARGDENFISNLSATTTDALAEGATNKYYTNARFDSRLNSKTTNDLIEGGNLYYTDTRARNALSVSSPLSYSTTTGMFTIALASATQDGAVSTTTQTFAGDKTFFGNAGVGIAPVERLTVAGLIAFSEQQQALLANSTVGFGKLFVKGATGGGNDKYTILLAHFDGESGAESFVDSSGQQVALTSNNAAAITATTTNFGTGALSLTGTSQYVSAPNSLNYDFLNNTAYTMDLWFRATNASGIRPLVTYGNTANSNYWSLRVNSGQVEFIYRTTNQTRVQIIGGAVATSTWYHLALVRSTSEGYKLFLNGVSVGTGNTTNDSAFTGLLNIGADQSAAGSNFFVGEIDEVRLSQGLSRYSADFTPESAPYGTGLFYQLANGSLVEVQGGGAGGSGSSLDVNAFHKSGDAFGATSTIGTLDTYGLQFMTGGAVRALFSASGDLTLYGDATFSGITTVGAFVAEDGITIASGTPSVSANHLYNQGGTLYFNGSPVGGELSGSLGEFVTFNASSTPVATNALFVGNEGNIGIGTQSPTTKLTVAGSMLLEGSARYINFGTTTGATGYGLRDKNGVLEFKNLSGGWTAISTSTGSGTGSSTPLIGEEGNILTFDVFGDPTATSSIFITSSGLFGIGTTSVNNRLSVNGAITIASSTPLSNTHALYNQAGTLYWNGMRVRQGDDVTGVEGYIMSFNSAGLQTATSSIFVAPNGFVGIGTTTPSSKLAIVGDIALAGSAVSSLRADGSLAFSAGAMERLRIAQNGFVGIGTTTPQILLHLSRDTTGAVLRLQDTNATCDISPTNGALNCSSDRSLKKNIQSMGGTLANVLQLNPIVFDWNKEEDGAGEHIGFVAQEVELLFPELVFTDAESGVKSIAYGNFAPILARAIQEVTSLAGSFKVNLIAWFSDTTNGITDFFAKKIHTEQICLKKSDGNEYCINGDDLEAIIDQKLSTKLSTPDIDNGAKEDVVLPEQQPQESMAEFFPTEIETVAATTTEEVTEITKVTIELLPLEDQDLPTEQTDKAIDIPASQEPVLDDSALITSNPLSTSDINNGFDYQSL